MTKTSESKLINEIEGAFKVSWPYIEDERGSFNKIFQSTMGSYAYSREGSKEIEIKECFITDSCAKVFRGMHDYNGGPSYKKLVTCLKGSVLDFLVDARKASKTFGNIYTIHLNGSKKVTLVIPVGVAHGFLALEDTTMLYLCTEKYESEKDLGFTSQKIMDIIPGNRSSLIMSMRDKNLPSFEAYIDQRYG